MGMTVGLVLGLAVGAAATAAWLLSEPDVQSTGISEVTVSNVNQVAIDRWHILRDRFQAALAEGRREGAATEKRMREQLQATQQQAASSTSSRASR